ncbi:DUF2167 domain-containing protein [Ectopseudomonas alcaliphila]|uniref:DUF2167 domain-containing protein n=1 Tax=Ectopseudomonas alcaliphila TaxID=101564 RepID=UPI002780847F|nr:MULTISPECIES: DUF2167 domain-containing protein [Pseudomonas]MDP9940017.1 putative membrane-anchored protein [Pseudomonas sp. 3400]MDR7012416.1 putative membrane-anchored protein [Pseudomonas alcaliphila]
MSIKDSILAATLAAALPFTCAAYANPETAPDSAAVIEEVIETDDSAQYISPEEFVASLEFKTGRVVLGNNLATLNLPDSLVFLDGENAQRLLVDGWGNPPDDVPPLGMILPADVSPLAEESWGVTVEYEASGYVSDEDAADIDYSDMLKDMQADMREANTWREENGYEPVQLVGWAAAPHYDAEGKKLHWAKELKFGDSEANTLNYNIRVLGRKGVLVLNFVANMDQLAEIEASVPAVLAATEFNPGQRYAEFDPDLDTVAAYGLGALVAGKVAAKTGLLALLLVLLKKFWFIPVILVGWLFKRIGLRKKEAPAEAVSAPVATAAETKPQEPAPAQTVMDLNKTDDAEKR